MAHEEGAAESEVTAASSEGQTQTSYSQLCHSTSSDVHPTKGAFEVPVSAVEEVPAVKMTSVSG